MTQETTQTKHYELTFRFVINYEKFFNYNRLYSYQDINFYFLWGARGIGKTTGALIKSIQAFNKTGEQFMYIRRFKEELDMCRDLLDKITDDTYCVSYKGALIYKQKHTKKTIGFGIPLTIQARIKSSLNLENVTTFIFDEVTIMTGSMQHYLKNEVNQLFELISSAVRLRTNYKVFFIGNNNDFFNPYTEYFNLPLKQEKIYINRERKLYSEMCKLNTKLLEDEKDTPLFALTKGTNYHQYHYYNEVLGRENVPFGVKGKYPLLMFRLIFNRETINVYYHESKRHIYCELKNKVIKDDITYPLMENSEYNIYYCRLFKESNNGKSLYRAFYCDDLEVDKNKTYSLISDYLSNI